METRTTNQRTPEPTIHSPSTRFTEGNRRFPGGDSQSDAIAGPYWITRSRPRVGGIVFGRRIDVGRSLVFRRVDFGRSLAFRRVGVVDEGLSGGQALARYADLGADDVEDAVEASPRRIARVGGRRRRGLPAAPTYVDSVSLRDRCRATLTTCIATATPFYDVR